MRKPIIATPFIWRDPATIRKRVWLYDRHYIRQFVSTTGSGAGERYDLATIQLAQR